MKRGGECALPDGHGGPHRSREGLRRFKESQRRYETTDKGHARIRRYDDTLGGIRSRLRRRHREYLGELLLQRERVIQQLIELAKEEEWPNSAPTIRRS